MGTHTEMRHRSRTVTLLVTLPPACTARFLPLQESSPRCLGHCLPIPQVSSAQYIASKQAAMISPQQPHQQLLTCSLVSRLAQVDLLQTVSQNRICVVNLSSRTCKSCYHQTDCYTSYELAYSFDMHPGHDMLQLPGCAAPDIRPGNYCVWTASPCICQLRSEPCC